MEFIALKKCYKIRSSKTWGGPKTVIFLPSNAYTINWINHVVSNSCSFNWCLRGRTGWDAATDRNKLVHVDDALKNGKEWNRKRERKRRTRQCSYLLFLFYFLFLLTTLATNHISTSSVSSHVETMWKQANGVTELREAQVNSVTEQRRALMERHWEAQVKA